MKSNYKALGSYIRLVDERNTTLEDLPLMGLSVSKMFFPTIANLVGTDMKTYKIVYKNQFTYIADTSRRGDKIAIALNEQFDKMLVSQAYTPFEVSDINELDPEYLMMWFRRPEFDRYARFKSHGSAREIFDWEEMCNTLLPIPSITKQRKIVKEYNIIQNRIALNQQLIQKLEETALAIYKHWFVDFEFPDEKGQPYKSSGGEMFFAEGIEKEIPKGWEAKSLGHFMYTTKGGDWGNSTPSGNNSMEVRCIRGTDIPSFQIGQLGDSPLRFILPKNCENKALAPGQIVIEISGGSPTQSTGRAALILDEHLNNSKLPIVCSNFCRALVPNDILYSGLIYSTIVNLYKSDVLFNFENSTIGLKNFDISAFLSEQSMVKPPIDVVKKYNDIFYKILRSLFLYGRQNEILIKSNNMFLSNLLLSDKSNS